MAELETEVKLLKKELQDQMYEQFINFSNTETEYFLDLEQIKHEALDIINGGRKYSDQAGMEKSTTEIILQGYNCHLTMLDNKSDGIENLTSPNVDNSKISNNSLLSIMSEKFFNLIILSNSDKILSLDKFFIPLRFNLIALIVVVSISVLYWVENLKNLIILKKSSSILVCGSPINFTILFFKSFTPC